MTSTSQFWLTVRQETDGKFTAQAVGLPEVHATRTAREEVIAVSRASSVP